MTLLVRTLAAPLILLPAAASAQTAPDPVALTKTVQKLAQRVDKLEKEVAKLKAEAAPAATAAATPPAVTAKRKPGEPVSVPGWAVDVLPAGQEDKDPVATFGADKPDFNFGMHTKYVSGHNPYTYRGTASFFPGEKARYVFQLTLSPVRTNSGYSFICTGSMKVNDEVLLEGRANGSNASGDFDRNGELLAPTTISGGSQMEPPTDPTKGYVLVFQVSCFTNEQDHAQLYGSLFKFWEDNRFSILVKGPDDASGRPFSGNELYHAGKVKAPTR